MSVEIKAKDVQMVEVGNIIENPKNPNRHSIEQIERLAKMIKFAGFRDPLIVSNRTGFLLCGHGRKHAAESLGMTHLPVSYQDFANEAEEYTFMTGHNEIARWSELDMQSLYSELDSLTLAGIDLDLLGIEGFTLPSVDKLDPQCDEDDVPESAPTRCQPGDVWTLGMHRLMCGDSTNIQHVEKLFNGATAELCFTSPPYADQREYNGGKELSTEHLARFISTAYSKAKYFAVNLGYSRKDGEVNQYWDDYIIEAQACGLKLLSWNVWDRSGLGGSIGNQTAMFPVWHEWVFVFGEKAKEINRTKPNKTAGSKSGTNRNADGSTSKGYGVTAEYGKMGTVQKCGVADGKLHPAMFPVEFPEAYIEVMTNEDERVYEPFTGSGTTLIACEKLNRIGLGMELDPKYCDVILARWEKYTGKVAVLEAKDNVVQ